MMYGINKGTALLTPSPAPALHKAYTYKGAAILRNEECRSANASAQTTITTIQVQLEKAGCVWQPSVISLEIRTQNLSAGLFSDYR